MGGTEMTQQSGWQLAGSGPESYERHNVIAFMDTSQDLVALAALRTGERVLDVACGTGVLARLAAKAVGSTGKVAGADLNEGMLTTARNKAEREELQIEWHTCDAAALSIPDGSFDVALCQWGLEFFSDRSRGLREVARVLVPGGRLVLRVWRALDRQPFYVALLDALERHLGPGAGAPIRAAFTLSDRKELRTLVTEAGFSRVHLRITTNLLRFPSLEQYVLGYLAATPIAARVASMGDQGRSAIVSDVAEALQTYIDDDGLAAPVENHIVVAQT
jgi:ubiquinone/menaquinone biosynthesis C-methylase UbiE